MTDDQRDMARALNRCTFLPGSFDKRFARDMAGYPAEKELTEKQAETLVKMFHRYRKQIAKQKTPDVAAVLADRPPITDETDTADRNERST